MNCLKFLTIAAVGLIAANIGFADSQIASYTEFGDPVYVTDGTRDAAHRWSAEAFAPDDLHDYGGDYRWPEPAIAPDGRNVAKTGPLNDDR